VQVAELNTRLGQLPGIPGYEVQRFIGRGGMGIVYRAVHLVTGRVVALKVVTPDGEQDHITRERFTREVRALASLRHPNIVPIYDAGDWLGFPYCSMEFIPGGTLGQHLQRIRADRRKAIAVMAKVARAVESLHAAGVLHRDLKPLNILLRADDEPMVADFGLARWVGDESTLTYTGLPVGTRQYMAPEQTVGRHEDYTPACDIWALGVILYEVLTGQRPFSDDGRTDIYHRIRHEDPPPASSHEPDLPPELDAVVRRCLAKQPEDRYCSAAAVADDLERWLAGEPAAPSPCPARLALVEAHAPPRTRVRALLWGLAAVLALAAGVGLYHRSSQPAKGQKTLAERVAAGEKVKLTDEKGRPTAPWPATADHPLGEKPWAGFNAFTTTTMGLAPLADESWELPIRVEADVAVPYAWPAQPMGGVYVGRRNWPGLEFKHESLVYLVVSPRHEPGQAPAEQLAGIVGLYWWDRDRLGSPPMHSEVRQPWNRGEKSQDPRFAHLVLEVREKEVRGSIDGAPLAPLTEERAIESLKLKLGDRPDFPAYPFAPPAFGTGIGVFCRATDCVVRDLTVSKLTP
jgi:hypothetical protein